MRCSLTLLVVLVLAYVPAIWAADELSTKPNIIFLLADDSGFADFGCYGHPQKSKRGFQPCPESTSKPTTVIVRLLRVTSSCFAAENEIQRVTVM